ncbi:type II secretion system protein [Humisphaera borealis]|uniref:Prepilin-type N-terminal cleavage/methylation domain-containing protein n=1 Tax=Humisphaera borealis TaxID=2807512 RepID=A0A7M2WSU1_9BACT|nr:prepilin-type N-terminal cleavage/methylation domain-containing protein [Humisphaera borealis]QOV88489.1 prepilin-type N-terminal cleavage/methylation domain-containing protein [Humisphaera borealis]
MTRFKSNSSARASAFTLVELLIVIGIIALLIGIAMPAFAAVQRESRKTACKSNLRQLGLAVRLYTDQNKNKYPRSPALPSVNPYNLPTVMERLSSFIAVGLSPQQVQSGQGVMVIFRCTADDVVFPVEKTSYFYYNELGERPIRDTFLFQVYKDISRVPVLWDADNYHGGNLPFNWLMADGSVDHWTAPQTSP